MSLSALKVNDSSIQESGDFIGGGSKTVDSDVYPAVITLAYLENSSKSKARAINLRIKIKGEEKELRFQTWITNGQNSPIYERDGKKNYLPGFELMNHLALLTCAKELGDLDTEEKLIKLWDKETKSETPQKAEVIPELIGKEVLVGILKQVVDKTKLNNLTGKYEATGETREENVIDKFFRERDELTVTEIRNKATEANFIKLWKDQWTGKVKNTAKGAKAGSAGTPGMPAQAATPTQSIFE